jgi:hypothetical protein
LGFIPARILAVSILLLARASATAFCLALSELTVVARFVVSCPAAFFPASFAESSSWFSDELAFLPLSLDSGFDTFAMVCLSTGKTVVMPQEYTANGS